MKNPDKAFWLTIVPTVLAWRFAKDPLIEAMAGGSTYGTWNNALFAGIVGLAAGYIGARIARPQYIRAAANVAFGLVVCYGLQNYIDYRGAGLPLSYFVSVPGAAAMLALTGGLVCRLQFGGKDSA